jgi:hypothetical protein
VVLLYCAICIVISSGLLSKAIQVTEISLLHVFHLHYDVSIPETALFKVYYDVSSAEIRALLSNARYTYLNLHNTVSQHT